MGWAGSAGSFFFVFGCCPRFFPRGVFCFGKGRPGGVLLDAGEKGRRVGRQWSLTERGGSAVDKPFEGGCIFQKAVLRSPGGVDKGKPPGDGDHLVADAPF